jgi:hypothetical protein
MASAQAPSPATKSNPFVILGEDNTGATTVMEEQEDTKVGWSFQGRKRQDPKQTPPRQTTQQLSPPPPPSQRKHPRRKERSATLRGPPLLLHLLRHTSPAQQGTTQSQDLAGPHQDQRGKKRNTCPVQRPISPKPSPLLQNLRPNRSS